MTQYRQSTRTKTSTKRSVRGAGVRDRAGVTTGSPWWRMHGRAVWDARPCVPSAPGLFRFPLCHFVFPRDLSILSAILLLRWMYLAHFPNLQFHSHTISSSSSFSFKNRLERERGRGEDCKDSMPALWSKDSSAFLVEQSFPSLLFSHF